VGDRTEFKAAAFVLIIDAVEGLSDAWWRILECFWATPNRESTAARSERCDGREMYKRRRK
jgi:hypothetical protein